MQSRQLAGCWGLEKSQTEAEEHIDKTNNPTDLSRKSVSKIYGYLIRWCKKQLIMINVREIPPFDLHELVPLTPARRVGCHAG